MLSGPATSQPPGRERLRREFGLSHLFWHERRDSQAIAGFGLASLVATMALISYEVVQDHDADRFMADMRNFRDRAPIVRLLDLFSEENDSETWPVDLWELIGELNATYRADVAAIAQGSPRLIPGRVTTQDQPGGPGRSPQPEKDVGTIAADDLSRKLADDPENLKVGALKENALRKFVFRKYAEEHRSRGDTAELAACGEFALTNRALIYYVTVALPWTLILCLPAVLSGTGFRSWFLGRLGFESKPMPLGADRGSPFVVGVLASVAISLVCIRFLPGVLIHLGRTTRYFRWLDNPNELPWPLNQLGGNPALFIQIGLSQVVCAFLLWGSIFLLRIRKFYDEVSPPVSICLILSLAIVTYGFFNHLGRIDAVVQVGAALGAAWIVLRQNHSAFKLRFPHMTIGEGPAGYYDEGRGVVLDPALATKDRDDEDGAVSAPALLDSEAVLRSWRRKLKAAGVGSKPVLAVVTTSGGSIRSAVWTAKVLTKLEREIDGFPYHLRLITGASGGMLGAGLYAASLPKPGESPRGHSSRGDAELQALVASLPRDSLSSVARCLALRDLPGLIRRGPMGDDRGRALEEVWEKSHEALAVPFSKLSEGERAGWRPSLVLSPMLVEDGRRLFISNLDLNHIAVNVGPCLLDEGSRLMSAEERRRPNEDIYSFSAYEFYRLFPEATRFRLSTAIRMSATFPFVSPAVSLPTRPPRRVVDAGYYDNFGVDVASMWITRHRQWLLDNTSGLVLIQIRAFDSPRAINPPAQALMLKNPGERSWRNGLRFLTSPIEGLLQARRAVMSFRNDEQLELIADWFEDNAENQDFFQNVTFECPASASVSWHITAEEHASILASFEPAADGRPGTSAINLERLEALKSWWRSAEAGNRDDPASSSLVPATS